jgi:hypothetical protein
MEPLGITAQVEITAAVMASLAQQAERVAPVHLRRHRRTSTYMPAMSL